MVGGDYSELLRLPDGAALLCVADVIGHGVPAALEAAILKTILGAAVERFTDPGRILGFLNERFRAVTPSADFASALVARLGPGTRSLEVALAGHEPGLLLRPGGEVTSFGKGGVVLGLLAAEEWPSEVAAVGRGTRLLVVTDGVTETRGADGAMFGRERVERVLAATRGTELATVVRRLDEEIAACRGGADQADDVTAVAVEFV